MNRVFSLLFLSVLLILSTKSAVLGQDTGTEKPLFVSSISIINDIVGNIAGDKAICRSIVPLGFDPHLYEATPEDALLSAKADLIFMNGLTLEGWLHELIDNSGTKASKYIVTDGIKTISSLIYENSYDPHAWMTASNGIIYAQNISEVIVKFDPKNKDYYLSNFEKYKAELLKLDDYIKTEIQKIPSEHRVLVTSHDAFQYFGHAYGIELESILGTSTDAEVQTSDMIRVSKIIKERGLPAIFVESTINPQLIEQISKENKIKIGGELYADSLGDDKSPASSYLEMLKTNTQTIVKALTSQLTEVHTDDNGKAAGNGVVFIGLGAILLIALLALVFRSN